MKAKGGDWTFDDLNKFIANPKGFVPGTAMGFAGIQKDSERADVIAYLRHAGGQAGPAADGGEITFRQSGMDLRTDTTARHCLAVCVSVIALLLSGRFAAPAPFPGCYHEEKAT